MPAIDNQYHPDLEDTLIESLLKNIEDSRNDPQRKNMPAIITNQPIYNFSVLRQIIEQRDEIDKHFDENPIDFRKDSQKKMDKEWVDGVMTWADSANKEIAKDFLNLIKSFEFEIDIPPMYREFRMPPPDHHIVGKCSKCGGIVTVPQFWCGVIAPVPTCQDCGATQKPQKAAQWTLPTIDME